jgi:rhodanese-related sulfurtransferase
MSRGPWEITARDLMAIGGLALLSFGGALVSNHFRPHHHLPRVYQASPVQADTTDIGLEQFVAFVRSGTGIVLDARPELFHKVGHVPGALSLPREDFDLGYARLKNRLESSKSGPIAVYCTDETCDDSRFVRSRLRALGFTRVAVYPGGWDEWTAAGLPKEVSDP